MQSFLIIIKLVIMISAATFGLIVWFKNKREPVNIVFALLSFATSFWAFGYRHWLLSDNSEDALFWNRILSIGSTLIPVFYFHWVQILLKKERKNNSFIILAYFVAGIFLVFSFSDYFIKGVQPNRYFSFWSEPGILYSLYLFLIYFGLVIFSVIQLIQRYRTSSGWERQQIFYILWGSILGFGGGATNFFLWYDIEILPWGTGLVALYPAIFAYAIIKHRLMGIRVIASHLYLYSLTALFSFLFFCLSYFFGEHFLEEFGLPSFFFFLFSIAVFFSIIFTPVFSRIQRSSDILFYNGQNPATVIKELSIKLSGLDDQTQMFKIATQELKQVLKNNRGIRIVLKKEKSKEPAFIQELLEAGEALVQSDLSDQNEDIKRKLRENQVEIAMPLKRGRESLGMILADQKTNQDAYTKEEIDFLEVIAFRLAVELERLECSANDSSVVTFL